MRLSAICSALSVILATGCATQSGPRSAWTIEPAVAVHHGMDNARASYELGRSYHGQGRLDEAEDAYIKATSLNPSDPHALSALGTLYAERGELERSIDTFKRVVSLAPTLSYLHNNLGYALLLLGRDEAAVASLHRAVEIDDNNRRAWRNLADAYRRVGKLEQAEDAEAKATGTWVGKIRTPTEGARAVPVHMDPRPEPITVGASPGSRNRVAEHGSGEPLAVVRGASAPAPAIHAASARLVKLADNVYELLTGPADTLPMPMMASTAAPAAPPAPRAPTPPVPSPTLRPQVAVAPAADPGVAIAAALTAEPALSETPNMLAAVTNEPHVRPARIIPATLHLTAAVAPDQSSARSESGGGPGSVRADRPVRYEISNGHGRNGLAQRIGTLLHEGGMAFPRLTNQRPFNEPESVVQYREGFRDAAEALVARLPFQPAIAPQASSQLGSDVRLLLGRDLSWHLVCIELQLCPEMASGPADSGVSAGMQPTLIADAAAHASD